MDAITISQFSKATGLNTGNVSRALGKLLLKRAILKKATPDGVSYGLQTNYDKWKPVAKKQRGVKKVMAPPPKKKIATADFERSFNIFWPVYPRKVAKRRALRAWLKIKPDEELVSRIIDAVKAHAKTDQWTKDNGQYIPHPATWLNGEQWNDAIEGKQSEMKW